MSEILVVRQLANIEAMLGVLISSHAAIHAKATGKTDLEIEAEFIKAVEDRRNEIYQRIAKDVK
jgi:hypothetical protein